MVEVAISGREDNARSVRRDVEIGGVVHQRKSPFDPQWIERHANQLPGLLAEDIQRVSLRSEAHLQGHAGHLQLARKGQVPGENLMDRSVIRRQRIHAAERRMRQHGGWGTIDSNVPGYGEDFEIHRGDCAAVLVCDKGIARKTARFPGAAGRQRTEPAGESTERECPPRQHVP